MLRISKAALTPIFYLALGEKKKKVSNSHHRDQALGSRELPGWGRVYTPALALKAKLFYRKAVKPVITTSLVTFLQL